MIAVEKLVDILFKIFFTLTLIWLIGLVYFISSEFIETFKTK